MNIFTLNYAYLHPIMNIALTKLSLVLLILIILQIMTTPSSKNYGFVDVDHDPPGSLAEHFKNFSEFECFLVLDLKRKQIVSNFQEFFRHVFAVFVAHSRVSDLFAELPQAGGDHVLIRGHGGRSLHPRPLHSPGAFDYISNRAGKHIRKKIAGIHGIRSVVNQIRLGKILKHVLSPGRIGTVLGEHLALRTGGYDDRRRARRFVRFETPLRHAFYHVYGDIVALLDDAYRSVDRVTA